jgi:hypothetical protein
MVSMPRPFGNAQRVPGLSSCNISHSSPARERGSASNGGSGHRFRDPARKSREPSNFGDNDGASCINEDSPLSAPLREFGPSIWIGEGPIVPFYFGFHYPTRMAVIRLSDGGLFIWSPVALSPALRRDVDALGPVRHLVAPNPLHHLFLAEWKSAYPEARLHAAPGLRGRRKDLAFDSDLGDAPDPAWAADLDQAPVRGSFMMTEVVFFHRLSRTAIFADLIENLPRDWFKGWRGGLARLDGIVAPHPGAPREWRASFVRRRAARASLEHILGWPIERVLIAHGEPASANGATFVREAFSWLLGRRPAAYDSR